jgi:cytochrome bd-type quinol oxidase subunit 2
MLFRGVIEKMKKKINNISKADYVVLTEILFIIMPLLIVLLYELSKNNVCSIFDKADWSFCTILFSGQLIIKLVSALLKKHHESFCWQYVALWLAIIIVLFLVPAATFICLMQDENVKLWVKILQIIWFALSIFGYFQLAGYAQEKEQENL